MGEYKDIKEIRIAVCDDEQILCGKLSLIISDILANENVSFDLKEFESGKSLLEQIGNIDLAFLDIEMPELDGISTGIMVKKKNPNCQIIIASGREDRFKETYKVKAMSFISKPYDKEEIRESLLDYMDECKLGIRQIEVFIDRNPLWIQQKDICYIYAFNSSVYIYTVKRMYRKEISMKQLEELLEQKIFFKVHRSYIVNLYHVTDYTDSKVLLKEYEVPLSKRQRKEFERAYMEFDVKYR